MTIPEVLQLVLDAATYDATVILWRTSRGVQPILLRRSIGRAAGHEHGTRVTPAEVRRGTHRVGAGRDARARR